MYEELIQRLREESEIERWLQPHSANETPKLLDDAADAIEELTDKNVGKWIPVTEDSPKEGFPVLGVFKFQGGNGCIVTERITINGEEIWSAAMGMKPFAWMPLPEPPKEE